MAGKQIITDTKAWYLHYTRDPSYSLEALYEDDPASTYQWDSRVSHYRELAVGDLIALWDADKDILRGVSVISWIETGEGTKKIVRCPKCSRTKIKLRKSLWPPYRCYTPGCKNEFYQPYTETVEVKTYRTEHSAGWIDLSSRDIDATFKADVCLQPKSQQSLRPLKVNAFQDFLKSLDEKIWDELRDSRNELVSVGQSIDTSISNGETTHEKEKTITTHKPIQDMLKEIGEVLEKSAEQEFVQDSYQYDVVWKERPSISRASNVFEVQDKGNVSDALAKLKHARDIWASNIFLVITQEKDRRRVEKRLRPYLVGTFHEIEPYLQILSVEQVEAVYKTMTAHKDLLKLWLHI